MVHTLDTCLVIYGVCSVLWICLDVSKVHTLDTCLNMSVVCGLLVLMMVVGVRLLGHDVMCLL